MITLRRAADRYDDQRGVQRFWLTFYDQAANDSLADGFGSLAQLNESRLAPGGSIPALPRATAEVITYVLEGALAYGDAQGRAGLMHAGEFRRSTFARGARSSETNPSRSDWAHVFQICFCSSETRASSAHEQKRFSAAERRGGLCLVASTDARAGSLRLAQDAQVFSTLLAPGQHVMHDLKPGRRAWLHLIEGELTLGDVVLTRGDGAGVSGQRPLSFTAREDAEVLLIDVLESPAQLEHA
jgi:redox-sensitive bicupin YhaK (pirin superfamily)